jgi:aminoglycoside/choline kinase family phosphotransferase
MEESCLKNLFNQQIGEAIQSMEQLPLAGSNRQYYRIKSKHHTLIGVIGTSIEENNAFIYMAQHFEKTELPTPKLIAQSSDKQCYLQEDLGNTSLFDLITQRTDAGSLSSESIRLLHQTMQELSRFQFEGAKNFDFSQCYPQPTFNKRTILWDLNYFKYCFLKSTSIEFQEDLLEDDFEKFADILLRPTETAFMYRDFQSRNVMIVDGKPKFIDFQGGRKGPIYYDLASFLWQAKAKLSNQDRSLFIESYIEALQPYVTISRDVFNKNLTYFVLFRTLQVLGAYGYRGYFERKEHFIQSIPYAINNLKGLLKQDFTDFPYISQLLQKITELKKYQTQ